MILFTRAFSVIYTSLYTVIGWLPIKHQLVCRPHYSMRFRFTHLLSVDRVVLIHLWYAFRSGVSYNLQYDLSDLQVMFDFFLYTLAMSLLFQLAIFLLSADTVHYSKDGVSTFWGSLVHIVSILKLFKLTDPAVVSTLNITRCRLSNFVSLGPFPWS